MHLPAHSQNTTTIIHATFAPSFSAQTALSSAKTLFHAADERAMEEG
jgi:hypothetical protein